MPELRCGGCGRLLGTTTRTQAVPAQCTDPICAMSPPISKNEERDSLIEFLVHVGERSPEYLAKMWGMTRQGIARIVSSR